MKQKIENFWTREESEDEDNGVPKTNQVINDPPTAISSTSSPKLSDRDLLLQSIMSFNGAWFTRNQVLEMTKIRRSKARVEFAWFKKNGYLFREGKGTIGHPFLYKFNPDAPPGSSKTTKKSVIIAQ